MNVEAIPTKEAEPWILKRHYAHRMPCVQFAYGLYECGVLGGVVTYGPPPTPAIKQAIMGGENQDIVLELNRLCVDSKTKNAASFLVGNSLKMLPKPSCVVSYADGGQGHVGYIYQATNFIFTGAVTAHDCEYMINGIKTHARSITAKGITDPMRWAKENGIETVRPMPKNRYVYFCGDKRQVKSMRAKLVYKELPYPKGETKRYNADIEIPKQLTFGAL